MSRRTMGLGVVCAFSSVLVLCAFPAEAQKTWVGDTEEWNVDDHWFQVGVPGANDDVVHTWAQGVPGILMDFPTGGDLFSPYKVAEFRLGTDWVDATEQGVLTFKSQFCEEEPRCDDQSIMSFVGGMDASGTVQNPLSPNLYRMRLGTEDVVNIGDVFTTDHPGGAIETTTHFE